MGHAHRQRRLDVGGGAGDQGAQPRKRVGASRREIEDSGRAPDEGVTHRALAPASPWSGSQSPSGTVRCASLNRGTTLGAMAKHRQLLPGSEGSGEVAVVFHFSDSAEVRYISHLPTPGQRVRSSNGAVWIVSKVVSSGENTFHAHCVAQQDAVSAPTTAFRPENTPRAQHMEPRALAEPGTPEPGAHEDLGSHVMTLARRAIEKPARLRRRYGTRNYVP
jgi:hypothetical protein